MLEVADVIAIPVAVLLLAGLVQTVIERVRARWETLDGDLVVGGSTLIGTALAWGFDLSVANTLGWNGLPLVLDYLVVGIFIAGGAGQLAAWKNSNRSFDPNSSLYRSH